MALSNSSPGTICYLVLESGHKTPVTRALYEQASDPDWVYLFADTEWQCYRSESPVVVKVTRQSPEYQWALAGLKEGQLQGLILESPEDLEAVVNWLRARLSVRFDGLRQGLLRFYDPWIWHRLSPGSGPETDVIARVIYWYGDPDAGRWLATVNPIPFTMLPEPTLDELQWQALSATDV